MGFVEIGSGDDMRAFEAKTLEFHTPSEHTIDGVKYGLEMHVIMTAIDRYIERHEPNMLILSVLFKPG
jgi:carbonic anhydrase